MEARYFTHVKKFQGSTLYVKVCDEGTFAIGAGGKIRHKYTPDLEDFAMIEGFVREGIWREIPIEEAVLL
jgi:hypothetical protein